jgi:hypothetical protein
VLLRWFPLARGLPGGAGDLSLCPASLSSHYQLFSTPELLTSLPSSPKQKQNRLLPPVAEDLAGCATGSARLLSAHLNEGELHSL